MSLARPTGDTTQKKGTRAFNTIPSQQVAGLVNMQYIYQKCIFRDNRLDWIPKIRPNTFNDTRGTKDPLSPTVRCLDGDPQRSMFGMR